jgi:hypothetical protein
VKIGELLTSSSIDVTGGDLLWDKLWHQRDDRGWSTLHAKNEMCTAQSRAEPTETAREVDQIGKRGKETRKVAEGRKQYESER